jgi:hypothetical protein
VCTAGRECQAISSPAAVHWLCQNARQGAFERPRDHDVVYVLELSAARGDRERKHGGRCRKAANGHDVAIGAAVRSRLRCMALMMVTTFTQATMVALGCEPSCERPSPGREPLPARATMWQHVAPPRGRP